MEWTSVAKSKTDKQLFDILSKPEDYEPEPLQAYRSEFEARGLDGQLLQQRQAEKKAQIQEKSEAPLSFFSKILTIILPLFWLRHAAFRARGEIRKYEEARRYSIIGIALYLSLLVYGSLRSLNVL